MTGVPARQTIVVTGANGLLGRDIVHHLLMHDGCTVIGVDLGPSRVDYPRYQHVQADVTDDRGDLDEYLHDYAPLQPIAVHGLVCAHGMDDKPQGFQSVNPFRDWRDILNVNLYGVANTCRDVAPLMPPGSSVVTIASLYGVVAPDQRLYDNGFIKPAAYAASKAGVIGLTRYLAALWADRGIRVNAVSPGGIGQDETPPGFRQRYEQRVPLGRMAMPRDVTNAVRWLLSSESAYVTGQNILVDGGFTIW